MKKLAVTMFILTLAFAQVADALEFSFSLAMPVDSVQVDVPKLYQEVDFFWCYTYQVGTNDWHIQSPDLYRGTWRGVTEGTQDDTTKICITSLWQGGESISFPVQEGVYSVSVEAQDDQNQTIFRYECMIAQVLAAKEAEVKKRWRLED